MAIEFRCTDCGKLLRTVDDTAGKQAKCPECGTVMTIPAAAPSDSMPPPPPPSSVDPAPALQPAGQPACAITPSTLDLGEVFSRTWTIFKPNWGNCLGVVILVWLMGFGVGMVSGFIPIVGSLISWVFQIWIGIGVALYFLKTARGQKVEIGEIFNGGPYFLKILLAAILLMLIVLGILVVCTLPSLIALLISREAAIILLVVGLMVAFLAIVYVMLVLSQYYYLILDRDVDVIESFTMSRDLMEGNKLTLFVIGLLCGLIAFVAVLPLFLGLLVAVPFFALMNPVIYLTITGQPMADRMQGYPAA
ncbi:MAG: DUF975 family protein [Pirellulales bacterium]|nr:DUF975 family protein [Pirellulales bacterium]